jgi:hypothetical protein
MAPSLRDRFFTPRVARAMLSPLGFGLAAGGAAIGLATGLGIPGAVVLAAAGWGGRVAAAMFPGGESTPKIDPFTVSEPWRRDVQRALSAQNRFQQAVDATPDGPLRDHLADIGVRLQHGIDEVWQVARRGHEIDAGLTTLKAGDAREQLARLEAQPAGEETEATREALESRLATAARLKEVSAGASNRLRLLEARLDELVARAVELSVGGGDAAVSGLGDDVDSLVSETEALRQALQEAERADGGGSPGGQPHGWPSS